MLWTLYKLELNGEKIKKLEKCCEVAKFWPPSGDNENDASEVPKVGKKQKKHQILHIERTKEN